ncbi:MAG: response regulator [Candidatus Omnitrophota bacterium]
MNAIQTRILVVDDEPDVGDFLKRYLSLRSFKVETAFSAEQALKLLEKENVDIILLDLIMHGMSGMEAAKIIREKFPSVKIIVITGCPSEAENLKAQVRLDGIFIKPVGIQELYIKLTQV